MIIFQWEQNAVLKCVETEAQLHRQYRFYGHIASYYETQT